MAHGRKRSFIGGFLAGIVPSSILAVAAVAALVGYDTPWGPPGYPYFDESGARATTLQWARLRPFPADIQSYTIVTTGNIFTRGFRVAFFGDPKTIAAWVQTCPGITDPKTTKTESPDGTLTYHIAPASGAQFAELIYHPVRGTVVIRTYWS